MSVKLKEIIKVIEGFAPKRLAEDWDNVGLQLGSYHQSVKKIILTLDVTLAVIEEAIEKKADLIIAHHPFIFKGLKNISTDNQKGEAIVKLIKNDIGLYVAHTNLDKSEMGLNAFLAQKLNLESIRPLEPTNSEPYLKLVVFSPPETTKAIITAFGKNGAGAIGNYDYCTYQVSGEGTFRPLEGSNPSRGEKNKLIRVEENRIEGIVPQNLLKNLIDQIKKIHPYEEMAHDIYPLENGNLINKNGNGKIALLKEPMSPEDFINHVKNTLDLSIIRGAGNPPKKIKKVAVSSGAGADFIGEAKAQKADVFITGDLKHHDGQRAEEMNLWVLDAGHYGTEKVVVECLSLILNRAFNEEGEEKIEIIPSEMAKDFISIY